VCEGSVEIVSVQGMHEREGVFVRGKGTSLIKIKIVVVQLDGGKVPMYCICPSGPHTCHTLSSPDTVSSRFFLWTSTRDLSLYLR